MTLGDAASLIDPFTGEGIGNALKSGMYAADAIADALANPSWETQGFEAAFAKYDARCERAFATEFKASYWLQRLLGVPGLFDFVVRKANRNRAFKDTLSSMFDAVDLRKEFRSPRFWWRVAFG
jgi:flavin-dependent dehydrogenase